MTTSEYTASSPAEKNLPPGHAIHPELRVPLIEVTSLETQLELRDFELVTEALKFIDDTYGPDGEMPLTYHNIVHTLGVMSAVDYLAAQEGVDPAKKAKLLVAASYHDLVHAAEHDGDSDERMSVQEMCLRMIERGYSAEEATKASAPIMATVPEFTDGTIMQPNVTDDILTQIIADADLAHLGNMGELTDEAFERFFWDSRSLGLWRQMNPDKELTPEVMTEWAQGQVHILEAFLRRNNGNGYFTQSAQEVYRPGIDFNIAKIKEFLASNK